MGRGARGEGRAAAHSWRARACAGGAWGRTAGSWRRPAAVGGTSRSACSASRLSDRPRCTGTARHLRVGSRGIGTFGRASHWACVARRLGGSAACHAQIGANTLALEGHGGELPRRMVLSTCWRTRAPDLVLSDNSLGTSPSRAGGVGGRAAGGAESGGHLRLAHRRTQLVPEQDALREQREMRQGGGRTLQFEDQNPPDAPAASAKRGIWKVR